MEPTDCKAMLKFVDTRVVFSEIPDEITLAINISGCPFKCPGCHSPYLRGNTGEPLTASRLRQLITDNRGITCVSIMGGDAFPQHVDSLSPTVRSCGLKYAWYSGRETICDLINPSGFDYIKTGPYIKELGPLGTKTTNQRMYKILDGNPVDISYRFNVC
jgi:anaerobic ribonucleoside-triphosphate reductase activating protein